MACSECPSNRHHGSSSCTVQSAVADEHASSNEDNLAFADVSVPVHRRPGTSPAPALTDANIVAILDAANESDSAFGAMAVKKAKSADVKRFARLMMSEHHLLRAQGQQLAKKLNVTPMPPANFDLPDKQHAAMLDLEKRAERISTRRISITRSNTIRSCSGRRHRR